MFAFAAGIDEPLCELNRKYDLEAYADDVLTKIPRLLDPTIVIAEAKALFGKYGLKIHDVKCVHTDPAFPKNFGIVTFMGVDLAMGGYPVGRSLSETILNKALK